MKTSDKIDLIASALVAAQSEFPHIQFDAVNPHFKNGYASLSHILDTIKPTLTKYKLAVISGAVAPETNEGALVGFSIETIILHASGQFIAHSTPVPVDKPSAQGAGSAITYGRRYGVCQALGLAPDADDDGESAENHKVPQAAAKRPAAPPSTAKPSAPRAPAKAAPKAAPKAAAPIAVPSCPTCGGDMWDNREGKTNPKAPDFKCKRRDCLDEKGYVTALWIKDLITAPRSSDELFAPVGAPSYDDEPLPEPTDDLPF